LDTASVQTVSIMMTDLVGSTELAARLGHPADGKLRQEHFSLIRDAVQEAGGREIKSRGDGLMVAFTSTAAAVSCAVSIQQRTDRRNRGAAEQLAVRIGISLGDASVENGDYYGLSVVEAARLCDGARGGQVLVTGLVRAVAARHGHTFHGAGMLHLRGLPEPVDGYTVQWEPLEASAEQLPLQRRLQVPPDGEYVGRDREQATLRALAAEARKGQLRIALISGEPGVGKTRLATHAALELYEAGATVLFGRCQEDLGIPYQPWVELIRHSVEHASPEVLAGHVRRSGGEIARLAPGLSRRLAWAPAPRETDAETERYLLWVSVTALLEGASTDRLVVLVLDDLHSADQPTLALLKHLALSDANLSLLVRGTYRQTDLSRGDALSELLAELRRESCAQRLTLEGLCEEDVIALMETVSGHDLDETCVALARQIAAETAGNPYFVGELLRHLRESGAIVRRENGQWRLARPLSELGSPQSIREVIGARVERLGTRAAAALGIASVIGREFDLELLSRVADAGEDELLQLLERAVAASLLHESDQVLGHFSFAHALVNHTLYEELSATRRARLHRATAEALEELRDGGPDNRVAELAHHWLLAGAPVDHDKLLEYLRRAGNRALAGLAPGEALRWFEQGLSLVDRARRADVATRCEFLIGIGDAQRQLGDAAFRTTLLEAARLAWESGDSGRLARAALANTREFVSVIGEVDAERVERLEQALEFPQPAAVRATLLSLYAAELLFGADLARRVALSAEALRLARESGDEKTLALVLARRFIAIAAPETGSELVEETAELARVADRLGDPMLQFWAAVWRACAAMQAGHVDELHRCVAREQELADLTSQPLLVWMSLMGRVWQAFLVGRIAEGEELAARAASLGSATGQPDVLAMHAGQLILARYEHGRLGELVDVMAAAAQQNDRIPFFTACLALAYCELDRFDEAERLLQEPEVCRFAELPRDITTLVTLAAFSEAAAQLRDVDLAEALYAQLSPWSGQVTINGITSWGAVDLYLGRLAHVLARREEAEQHLTAAARMHERIHAPSWLARTHYAMALLMLEDGADMTRGYELAALAHAAARELGLRNLQRRSAALVDQADKHHIADGSSRGMLPM
jgi:class 3 adenylate cyclase